MKIERDSFDVQSTMQGEKVAMGIRVEDMAHIMAVMTDLYKDRLLAVLREYSTNALDAHIEAGISLPIEITLPSDFDPTLKVRDYGVGLDAEDIRTVYSQYGRSTKRGTNDQVGMLGLGCKSALTYGTQFTVSSVKDGNRVTVLVSREEDGAGMMQILGNSKTDDANGTEVMVAIRREDIRRARTLADDFFQYWSEGSVLVNGRAVAPITGLKLSDSMLLVGNDSGDKVVMGNVAYPASLDLQVVTRYGGRRDFSLVCFVPIGSVRPTPSRESLMDTKDTKDTFARLALEFRKNIDGAIQREVDAAESPQAAIRVVSTWQKYIPSGNSYPHSTNNPAPFSKYTYKGIKLPDQYEGFCRLTDFFDGYYRKSAVTERGGLHVALWPDTVWVQNYTPAKFVAQHKDKLRKLCAERAIGQDGTIKRFSLLSGQAPTSPFINPAYVLDWEDVRKVKLDPKTSTTRVSYKSIPGSFDVYTEEGWKGEVKGDDIRTTEPIFWMQGNRWAGQGYVGALNVLFKKYTLVCLPGNRVEKFKRDVPSAKEPAQIVKDGFEKWAKSLPEHDLKALAMYDEGVSRHYSALDASKVQDPDIKEAVKLSQRDIQKIREARDSFRGCMTYAALDMTKYAGKLPAPLKNYPLYSVSNLRYYADDMYLYLNAAYVARKGKKP